jgi:hypothetical protein
MPTGLRGARRAIRLTAGQPGVAFSAAVEAALGGNGTGTARRIQRGSHRVREPTRRGHRDSPGAWRVRSNRRSFDGDQLARPRPPATALASYAAPRGVARARFQGSSPRMNRGEGANFGLHTGSVCGVTHLTLGLLSEGVLDGHKLKYPRVEFAISHVDTRAYPSAPPCAGGKHRGFRPTIFSLRSHRGGLGAGPESSEWTGPTSDRST